MRSRFLHILFSCLLLSSLSGFTVMRVVCANQMLAAKQKKPTHSCCDKKPSKPVKLALCCDEGLVFTTNDAVSFDAKAENGLFYTLPSWVNILPSHAFVATQFLSIKAPPKKQLPKYLLFCNFRN